MPWEKQFNEREVLEKAMHAFWEHGYAGTSLADLLKCTGINRGSLYATYRDKHTMFLDALRLYDESVRKRLLRQLESTHRPREAIRRLFMTFVDGATAGRSSRGCFMTNTALELAAHDPEVATLVAASQQDLEAFFVRVIRAGKQRGEIPESVQPAAAARGLLASLLGLIVLSRSRPEKALLTSVVDDALQRLD